MLTTAGPAFSTSSVKSGSMIAEAAVDATGAGEPAIGGIVGAETDG
jgi:hypothetical protein